MYWGYIGIMQKWLILCGVVLRVPVKEGSLGVPSLKEDPSQKGNLPYGDDKYFEQLPYRDRRQSTSHYQHE